MTPTLIRLLATASLFGASAALPAAAAPVRIKLGTVAPEGSVWHEGLLRMAQRWADASGGSVALSIYPGGVLGDEGTMIRKMRIGQIHASTLTNVGLGAVSSAPMAMQIPMMIDSYEELDVVRAELGPSLAKEIEKRGFVVLSWGDAGWVHFFSRVEATKPEEFRRLRMFVGSDDQAMEDVWRNAGFNPTPISSTDLVAAIKTGMIDGFLATPLFALASGLYKDAPHMLALRWIPLAGATIVSAKQWRAIDPAVRTELERIAQEEGDRTTKEVRRLGDEAIRTMSKRGLAVHRPSDEAEKSWRREVERAYPRLRGSVVQESYFDEAVRILREARARATR